MPIFEVSPKGWLSLHRWLDCLKHSSNQAESSRLCYTVYFRSCAPRCCDCCSRTAAKVINGSIAQIRSTRCTESCRSWFGKAPPRPSQIRDNCQAVDGKPSHAAKARGHAAELI